MLSIQYTWDRALDVRQCVYSAESVEQSNGIDRKAEYV